MRKFLSVLLCVLMLCTVLCGCGGNDSVSEMATDAMSEAESVVDGVVSDGDGHIGNETTSSTDSVTDDSANGGTSDTNGSNGTGGSNGTNGSNGGGENNAQSTTEPMM